MVFEERLERYRGVCEQALGLAADALFRPASRVSEAARYALMNGGKRVRGVLALSVCEMLGGREETAADFAAAVEMVHAFSLVHDDLPCMDDDDVRRGKPAAHIAFGQAPALLAGDLLAIQAFEQLARARNAGEGQRLAAVRVLAHAAGANGMIFGQELDMAGEGKAADEAGLRETQAHKTGALISAAARLGVLAAGQEENSHPAVLQYARNIGLVFQIVDDILDVTAEAQALGKPVGSDARRNKTTMVSLHGILQARRLAQELTQQAAGALRGGYGENASFLCEYAARLNARTY